MVKLIKPIIILLWLVMFGMLIERSYWSSSAEITLDVITDEGVRTGDEWSGIYQQGRKIGYAHSRIVREADTYHLSQESELDLLLLGSVQRVKTVIHCYTTINFALKYFNFSLQSDFSSLQVKGAVVGKKIILDITSAGQTRTEHIPIKEAPYLSPGIKPALVLLGLEPGKKYRFPLFNPATMTMDEAVITVEARENIKVGDSQQTVYRLKESFQGMEARAWMTEAGDTIKEESPLGYVLLKETMAEAKKRDKKGPAVDIMSLVMIKVKPISNPGQTRYLRAKLSGQTFQGFDLHGDRQNLMDSVIEIDVPEPSEGYDLPFRGREFPDSLQPTVFIQSNDVKIRAQATKIVAGERNAREAAKKLNEWVYSALEKKPVVSIPSAVEVLSQLVGDCNEHATLYTALARAVGIPARIAAGIVYMRDGFYYHAWPEIWLGAWTAVDPTFNQFPADATHIRFVTGGLDRQSDILRLVGRLKVEVENYR